MNNRLLVHVLKTKDETAHHEPRLNLCKTFTLANMESQVSSSQEVTAKIEIFPILKRVTNID